MKLIELNVAGFGRLVEHKLEFHPKINIIFGPNEAGKSTLQQSILALLYGFYNGQRASRSERLLHERFRPWHTKRFEGSLKYQLGNGRMIFVQRDFSDEDIPTQLLDAVTGKNLSTQFRRGRHGQIDFIEKQIGMSRGVFQATAFVKHGALNHFAERDAGAVSDAILRLLDSATTETSAELALERLEKALRELGSERSQKSRLTQARQRLEDLHQTKALRMATQKMIQDDLTKAETLELEIEELGSQLAAVARRVLEVRLGLLRDRLSRWHQNEERHRTIANEMGGVDKLDKFPADKKEEFFQLRDEHSRIEKHQSILVDERNSLELRMMGLEESSKTEQLPEEIWQQSSFEDFLALRQRWQSSFDSILNMENAKYDADKKLNEAGFEETERGKLANLEWQKLEEYKEHETQLKEAEEQVDHVRTEYDEFQFKTVYRRRVLAFVGFISAIILLSVLFSLTTNESSFSTIFLMILSTASLIAVISLNVYWTNKHRDLGAELVAAENRYMEERQDLRYLLAQYRVESVDELMQRRAQYVELGAVEQSHKQLEDEMKKIEGDLQPWMSAVGIGHIAPETLQDAEKRLRESHKLWSEKALIKQRLEESNSKQKELAYKYRELTERLESILHLAGIHEPVGEKAFQTFMAGLQKREYLDTMQMQMQQSQALSDEILEGSTVASLNEHIEQLETELWEMPEVPSGYLNPVIETSKNGVAQLREIHETILTEIHNNKQSLSAVKERVATRLQDLPPLAEIEEDIALAEGEVARFERARQALEIAHELIEQSAHKMHRDFVPRLNDFLTQHLNALTEGRYTGALIDPSDFSVRLISQDHTAPIDLNRLSFGTREQIYLLLRTAIVELFSRTGESIPLFLDDPLVHADDQRMSKALGILETLTDKHQVFYFTKDEDVASYARERYGDKSVLEME